MKKFTIILVLLLLSSSAGAVDRVILQDSDSSGTRANVIEVGEYAGLAATDLPGGTIYNGHTTTNAGTAVVVKADTDIKALSIKALATNTGDVYVGDSSVDNTNGYILSADEGVDMNVNNTNVVYIDVEVNGEGICYLALD